MKERLEAFRKQVFKQQAEEAAIKKSLARVAESSRDVLEYIELLEQAQILLQRAGEQTRDRARERLEEVVSNALQYVFGPDFEFKIELTESRGRAEAEFYVTSVVGDTTIKCTPQDSRGGGVVDIVSLALRIAMLQLYRDPKLQGPIILDEPGKHVSEDYAIRLATFLEYASKQFKRQIIMVTHQQHLAEIADRAFQVEIRGGSSRILAHKKDGDYNASLS